MEKLIIIILFILGVLFSNASHIPQWLLFSAGKPNHPRWKIYGVMATIIWILLLILVNNIL